MSLRRKTQINPTIVEFKDGLVMDDRFKALETRLEATEQHAATERRILNLEAEIKSLSLHSVNPSIKQEVMMKLAALESRAGSATADDWLRERQRIAAMQKSLRT
jgi:hypothetical protein